MVEHADWCEEDFGSSLVYVISVLI